MSIILKKENFAASRLASGIGASETSLTLAAGQGALFPQSGPFRAVIWGANYTSPASDPSREIVEAALGSADTFTISRAREGTTAGPWSASSNIALTITRGVLDEYEAEHSSHASRLDQAESDIAAAESDIAAAQSAIMQHSSNIAALDTRVDALESFSGALAYKSSVASIPSGSWTALALDQEEYDTDAFHSTVSNTDRLTVPTGVTRVRLTAQLSFASSATGARGLRIVRNADSTPATGLPNLFFAGQNGGNALIVASAVISVSAGDYFRVQAYQDSGSALNANTPIWFAIEVVG